MKPTSVAPSATTANRLAPYSNSMPRGASDRSWKKGRRWLMPAAKFGYLQIERTSIVEFQYNHFSLRYKNNHASSLLFSFGCCSGVPVSSLEYQFQFRPWRTNLRLA
jgi:hypothetical protein